MTRYFGSRLAISIVLVVFSILAGTARVSADDGSPISLPKGAPAPPSPDDPKYDLRYKLAIGEVLRYEVTHRASIQSTIEQTTQAAQTKTDSIKGWKVTDVLPSGEIEFMNVVERVAMVNQLPDRDPLEYDSQRDKTPPAGFEDAAKAVGVPLSVIRMTPQGKVTRRDIRLRQLQVDEDAPVVVRLPDKPVPVDATWDEPFDIKVELQAGATKQIQTRRHHKLAKVTGDIATIEVTYQVLSPVDPSQEAQLIERMMSGTVEFNIATGRVVGQKMGVDKRILGFAGPTSSMQYVMTMTEKLLNPPKTIAAQPPAKATTKDKTPPQRPSTEPAEKSAPTTVATPPPQTRPLRTVRRPRSTPQSGKGYVR
jgi:hypothetical protein